MFKYIFFMSLFFLSLYSNDYEVYTEIGDFRLKGTSMIYGDGTIHTVANKIDTSKQYYFEGAFNLVEMKNGEIINSLDMSEHISNLDYSKIAFEIEGNKYISSDAGLIEVTNNGYHVYNRENSDLSINEINNMIDWNDKIIIFNGFIGFNIFDTKTKEFEVVQVEANNPKIVPHIFYTNAICNDSLLFYRTHGHNLVIYNLITKEFKIVTEKEDTDGSIYKLDGFVFFKYNNEIYISDNNQQVYTYKHNKLIETNSFYKDDLKKNGSDEVIFEILKYAYLDIYFVKYAPITGGIAFSNNNVVYIYSDNHLLEVIDLENIVTENTLPNIKPNPGGRIQYLIDDFNEELYISLYSYGLIKTSLTFTSVENVGSLYYLNLYPNPAKDNINLEFMATQLRINNLNIGLFDILGRQIETSIIEELSFNNQTGLTTCKVNIGAVPKGMYYLRVNDGNDSFAKPIFIE